MQLYQSVLQQVLGGITIADACEKCGVSKTHWRRIRSIAELSIVDPQKFLEIFNSSSSYKVLENICRAALDEPSNLSKREALVKEKKILPMLVMKRSI